MKKGIITIDMLGSFDKMTTMQNEFMHAADVFEKSKHMASYKQMDVTTQNLEHTLSTIHGNLKSAIESKDGYIVFIAIKEVNGEPYKDDNIIFTSGVRIISTGSKWFVFKDVLEQLGYSVETDKTMVVTNIN